MKINIVGRQLNVYDDTKQMICDKLVKFDKFFDNDSQATVTLSHKHGDATIEITIKAAGTIFRSEVDDESFRSALDKSIDNIERQIRKNKTRLKKSIRSGDTQGLNNDFFESYDEQSDDEPEFVIRTKKFEFSPMSVEEAIMQMNLLGHSFFVFHDTETSDTCVVYKRKDGNYGLIIPE